MTKDDLLRMEQPELAKLIDSGELRLERYGEWEFIGALWDRKIYKCSECKNVSHGAANFCKECGAKMDGKEQQK